MKEFNRENVLAIISDTPLGYRTKGEHEVLEAFADKVEAKIAQLQEPTQKQRQQKPTQKQQQTYHQIGEFEDEGFVDDEFAPC